MQGKATFEVLSTNKDSLLSEWISDSFWLTSSNTYFISHFDYNMKQNAVTRYAITTTTTTTTTSLNPLHLFNVAYVWGDLDRHQLSKTTRIMVHQRNRWIHSGQGFICSDDTTDLGSLNSTRIIPKGTQHELTHLIGPLHDTVTCYGINYAETQITQWDFQNN